MSGSPKEFNKWYDNIEKEYPMYQDKDGYNIGNYRALRIGWKAALRWVLSIDSGFCNCGAMNVDVDSCTYDLIEKEWKEE